MSEHEFLKHLRKDHDEQKSLGKRMVAAKTSEERKQLREKFHESLYPHMIGEEASIFPKLIGADDEEAKDDGQEGVQEHHVAKLVLRELMDLDPGSDIFKAKAKVLDELNRHHIEEEEGDVFKHLNNLCDEKELDQLFKKYESAEEKAKSE